MVSCHSYPGLLCPCVPCIAAQAVVRVGVRMAGWAVRTGLRSWCCDGVRGQLRGGCGYPFWTACGRLGADRAPSRGRDEKGKARLLASGTWHIWHAVSDKRQRTSKLLLFIVECGVEG